MTTDIKVLVNSTRTVKFQGGTPYVSFLSRFIQDMFLFLLSVCLLFVYFYSGPVRNKTKLDLQKIVYSRKRFLSSVSVWTTACSSRSV